MDSRSLRMTMAYDGGDFAGWQRQPGKRTVQGEVEKVLGRITGESIAAIASGRTDAGVHALGQVVGFRTRSNLGHEVLLRAINAELPGDIAAFDVRAAPDDFDPIRDAVRKRYRYVIEDSRVPDLFARRYLWHVRRKLDVDAMREAAAALVGQHDFAAYETAGSRRLSTVRTVFELLVERRAGEWTDRVVVEVEADGFLYNMVRNIVGTLVTVGRGKRSVVWPATALASRDRRQAGMSAPPRGLFLMWVKYEV